MDSTYSAFNTHTHTFANTSGWWASVCGRRAVSCDRHIVSPLADPWTLTHIHPHTQTTAPTGPFSLYSTPVSFHKPAVPFTTVLMTQNS